jgi:hypothetical protein
MASAHAACREEPHTEGMSAYQRSNATSGPCQLGTDATLRFDEESPPRFHTV